jgi:hypothetical protein
MRILGFWGLRSSGISGGLVDVGVVGAYGIFGMRKNRAAHLEMVARKRNFDLELDITRAIRQGVSFPVLELYFGFQREFDG